MAKSFEPTSEITIPTPQRTSYPRGQAAKKVADLPTSIRLTKQEKDTIKEAAKIIGMPYTDMIRWNSYFVANEIVGQKRRYDQAHPRS